MFARGSDRALWHIWQVAPNGTWSGWKSEGGWIDLPSTPGLPVSVDWEGLRARNAVRELMDRKA